jgi:S-layer homology domain
MAKTLRVALAVCGLFCVSLLGAVQPRTGPAAEKFFRHPDLYVPELTQSLEEIDAATLTSLQTQIQSLGVAPGTAFYDSRVGRWSSLILSLPLIPGSGVGNDLAWPAGRAPQGEEALKAEVWNALRAYLKAHESDLRLDLSQLSGTPRVTVLREESLVFVHAQRVVDGIPVRDNSLGAAINSGNLILLGLQKWGDVDAGLSRTPAVRAEAAEETVRAHVRPLAIDAFTAAPRLELVPMSVPEGIAYRLAWVVACKIEDDLGNWEGLVDAGNGTLIAFEDRNQYLDGQIIGGVYPVSNDQRPPDGIEQPGAPMPYVDFTIDGVKRFTDGNGNMGCIPGSVSTALSGLFIRILDSCGAINETGTNGIDLASGPTAVATDCSVPAGHSAGDTKSSRSGFFELNRQAELARAHLPGNAWLNSQLTANMNLNDICNAFWDGATVNFFRSSVGDGCANTGEIAAIFDHEWGHGLDNNGVNPNIASPGESIADIYAALRLNTPCIGRGFLLNDVCSGYGDACDGTPATGCTGVRDIDFENHRCDRPHTISWILSGFTSVQCGGTGSAAACPPVGSVGPCNRETHCEGYVMAETAWDLMTRDLVAAPFNFDSQTAHEVATRILYAGAQPINNWYTCSVGGGCSATGGYLSMLAADDDNGNLNDGTPHMTAIRAAFERHEIHCATPAPTNSGCAGGPVTAPVVTLQPQDRAVALSWTAVAGADSYLIYRGDGIDPCAMGKVIVAEVTELSFVDTGLQNGRSYSYGVMPVGANPACTGRMSVCQASSPVPGPNLAILDGFTISGGDGDPFLDNCEIATVGFSVNNIGVGDLTNLRIVAITPVTHPLSTVLTPLPAPIAPTAASCTVVDGSFQIQPQGLTFDGSTDILIEVAADELGDTRSKLIHLTHTESDLVSVASQTFSFEADEEGWTATSGTFVRKTGSGANGTNAHMSSSENLDNQCDVVQSPLFVLTNTSTLTMRVRYEIEPQSSGEYWDRANVGVIDGVTGERTVIVPSSGRPYSVPNGSANGVCGTGGQAGWNGATPGHPTLWYDTSFDQAALNPGGAFTDRLALLQVNYGADEADARDGIDFDEVTLTDFFLQVADANDDDCSQAAQVAATALAVDAAGNGVLEAGETAGVSPTWMNTGLTDVDQTGTASNFTGPAGPTYDLTDSTAVYGLFSPGDSATCSDCYSVTITAATRPATHWDAVVTETVSPTSAGKDWILHVGESFTDVPSSSGFYAFVENVLHNGVTAGCGAGTTFCPADPVTRQQMAVFLLKAKEGACFTPPPCTTQVFDDVPCASPFAPWINELSARGITAGCGPTSYCPTDATNRQQMAVFLLKTKEGSGFTPPPCTTQVFDDVPCASPFAPWVNELVARAVTAGCGGNNYCPTNPVARQQMAVFLVKTFGLLLYGP